MKNPTETDSELVQETSPGVDTPLLWTRPGSISHAALLLAHGAGAPMDSPFMQAMAQRLADRGVTVVRFEFPYMLARRSSGSRRPPNPAAQLLSCWRAVYQHVRSTVDGALAIGGKSMGGRMASMLADELAVDALVCLGYPFHPAGKPDKLRVSHLQDLRTPSLIVQGERDALGSMGEVLGYPLSANIQLHWLMAADHDLRPLKASGLRHDQHLDNAADAISGFLARLNAAS